MNDKFYALPKEKQNRIINAGFRDRVLYLPDKEKAQLKQINTSSNQSNGDRYNAYDLSLSFYDQPSGTGLRAKRPGPFGAFESYQTC